MIRNDILRRFLQFQPKSVIFRTSSAEVNIKKLENEQEAAEVVDDEEARQREEELEKKRDKSRLSKAHYKMLHEENPYPEPMHTHHGTLKYLRKTYGLYGNASEVDPMLCWPVKEEMIESLEYERVKYPYTIPQMIEEAKAKREAKERSKMERQQEVLKKMEKLEQWKKELQAKIYARETEAIQAKARKDRLIEEVRRHFGYVVDPKDERFKELLEKKEKEQKKEMKEARRKAKEEKMVSKLLSKKSKKEENEQITKDASEEEEEETHK